VKKKQKMAELIF